MQDAFIKRPFVRIALVVIVFAAAAGILIGDFVHHAAGRKLASCARRFLRNFSQSR